jgi:hypothetical protein
MAKHTMVVDDTRALYVMDGELKITLDGEQDGGGWEGKLGSGEWWLDDNEATVLADYDGNVVATLCNDDDWDAFLAGKM